MLSHVAVPLRVNGEWVCALLTATAVGYRSWTDADVERIRIIGQVLANAVYRRNLERELAPSLSEVRHLKERLEAENEYLREAIEVDAGFEEIAGKSHAIRAMLEAAAQVAPTIRTGAAVGRDGHGQGAARARHPRAQPALASAR